MAYKLSGQELDILFWFKNSTIVVAIFATTAGYGVYASQRAEAMSDLMSANVEALARYEGDGYCHTNIDYSAICNYYDIWDICPCGF